MSKAVVTFEDAGDEVAVSLDFGPEGGQETSGAHQMAASAVHGLHKECMTNYHRTSKWVAACGKQVGNPEHLSVQIGVDLEETAELLRCLRVSKEGWARLLERLVIDLESLGKELKQGGLVAHFPEHLREDVLDALCDREVTGNAVAYLAGFDKDGADQEVLRSNESKLENGKAVILPGGKIGKGKDYSPPNLKPFV